jgi:hypothetical protein
MNCRLVLFAFAACAAFVNTALAASRDETLEAVAKCATLVDDKLRLGCYDSLAPRIRDALGTPPEALAHNPTAEEQKSWFGFDIAGLFGQDKPPQTSPQQFGQENVEKPVPAAPEMDEINSISAKVTDYSFHDEKFIVFLDNGQVWEQLNGDSGVARFKSNAKDNTVTISRGFLKSYNLKVNDDNSYYKVKRIK